MFRHVRLFAPAALAALLLPSAALAAGRVSTVKAKSRAPHARTVKGTVLQVDRAHHVLRVVEGPGKVESFRTSGRLAGAVRPGSIVSLQAQGHSATTVQARARASKLQVLGRVVSSSSKGLVVSLPDGRLFTVGSGGRAAAHIASDQAPRTISLNIQGLTPGQLVLITVDFSSDGNISITVALEPGQVPSTPAPPAPAPAPGSGDQSGDGSGDHSSGGSSDAPSCPAPNVDDGKVLGVNHTNGTFTIGAAWSSDTVYSAPASVLTHIHQGDYVLVTLDPAQPGTAVNAQIVSSTVSSPDPGVKVADGTVSWQDSTAAQFTVVQSNHSGSLTFDAACWVMNQVWTSEDVHVIYHTAPNGDLVADAVNANDGSEF